MNRPYRNLVPVGTPDDLKALEVALVETDPTNTEVVVVTAHTPPEAGA